MLSLSFYFRKPTLASDIPFFRDIIIPYEAGVLFVNESSEDLKRKLIEILSTNTERMVEKGRLAYKALYETSSIREQLIGIYNQ